MVELGTPHSFRNATDEEIRFRTELRPALTYETFMETMFGLARDGKTDEKGMPNPFRLAVIMDEQFNLVRLPSPPASMERTDLALGAPLGRLLGYEPGYVPLTKPETDGGSRIVTPTARPASGGTPRWLGEASKEA